MQVEIQTNLILPRLEKAKKAIDNQINNTTGLKHKTVLDMIEASSLLFAVNTYIKDHIELKEQENVDMDKLLRKEKNER